MFTRIHIQKVFDATKIVVILFNLLNPENRSHYVRGDAPVSERDDILS